jgi:Secretion system C-terminal sorting domain
MKKILIFAAFATALALHASAGQAQMMLQKAVISSGGATSSNATMQMGSTAGQPVVGAASNSQMRVQFGFWTPAAAAAGVAGAGATSDLGLQAWPNPTTSGTRLTITLGTSENLDLRLFDVTGKEVRRIYNGPASGTLGLDLDVSNLSSGSYILAARIPGQLVEKRISVIR